MLGFIQSKARVLQSSGSFGRSEAEVFWFEGPLPGN